MITSQMRPRPRTLRAVALSITIACLLWGCSKVTPENYAKLKTGMSRTEVHTLLGPPKTAEGAGLMGISLDNEVFTGSKSQVKVTYVADKLVLKTMEDLP